MYRYKALLSLLHASLCKNHGLLLNLSSVADQGVAWMHCDVREQYAPYVQFAQARNGCSVSERPGEIYYDVAAA
jgi:hypothetical protein